MNNKIDELREELYIMLDAKEISYDEILAVSQELDELIVGYYD